MQPGAGRAREHLWVVVLSSGRAGSELSWVSHVPEQEWGPAALGVVSRTHPQESGKSWDCPFCLARIRPDVATAFDFWPPSEGGCSAGKRGGFRL